MNIDFLEEIDETEYKMSAKQEENIYDLILQRSGLTNKTEKKDVFRIKKSISKSWIVAAIVGALLLTAAGFAVSQYLDQYIRIDKDLNASTNSIMTPSAIEPLEDLDKLGINIPEYQNTELANVELSTIENYLNTIKAKEIVYTKITSPNGSATVIGSTGDEIGKFKVVWDDGDERDIETNKNQATNTEKLDILRKNNQLVATFDSADYTLVDINKTGNAVISAYKKNSGEDFSVMVSQSIQVLSPEESNSMKSSDIEINGSIFTVTFRDGVGAIYCSPDNILTVQIKFNSKDEETCRKFLIEAAQNLKIENADNDNKNLSEFLSSYPDKIISEHADDILAAFNKGVISDPRKQIVIWQKDNITVSKSTLNGVYISYTNVSVEDFFKIAPYNNSIKLKGILTDSAKNLTNHTVFFTKDKLSISSFNEDYSVQISYTESVSTQVITSDYDVAVSQYDLYQHLPILITTSANPNIIGVSADSKHSGEIFQGYLLPNGRYGTVSITSPIEEIVPFAE